METKIEYKGLDFEEIAIYIALNNTATSVPYHLRKLVPVRKYARDMKNARGRRPCVSGEAALSGARTHSYNQWRFTRSPDTYTATEQKQLFAEAVKIGVKALFTTHLYTFANKVYLQTNGCPIGVRASAGLARLTCNSFDQEFKRIMDTNKLETELVFRYLDDHRIAMGAEQ